MDTAYRMTSVQFRFVADQGRSTVVLLFLNTRSLSLCFSIPTNMASSEYPTNNISAEVHEYYTSAIGSEARRAFKNLDDAAILDSLLATVQSSRTRNFIVDFSDGTSCSASNLSHQYVAALLEPERPEVLGTRWINIWHPSQQKSLLELLAKRYDFSPRLLALMCSDPRIPRYSRSSSQHRHNTSSRKPWVSSRGEPELEKGFDELSEQSSISSAGSVTGGNLYRIIKDLWHYSSIDFGRNYVCLGYNSLYGTKHAGEDPGDGLLPHCIRIWTWLLLCEDNTVISINEDPFPFSEGSLDPLQQRIVAETRRNLLNVFRSLSKVEDGSLMTRAPMALLPIRSRLGDTAEETAHRSSDIPGLLFYYLFENWHNSYTLITRRESRYGIELNKLRSEMFESPKLSHIDRLDSIGKELGVLRRHFEGYNRIIERLLEPQNATTASLQNSRVLTSQTSLDTVRPLVTEKESMLGVSLSSPARVRFRRLKDLIDLYALSEVEEYLKQKESLAAMNFQLIAIKESLDVERLTRITLLLTKVTIIFLPVSFMTSYFSVPLHDMLYTVKEYWTSFAIIFALSWTALFVFGVFSGSVQTVEVWRSLWQGLKTGGRRTQALARSLERIP